MNKLTALFCLAVLLACNGQAPVKDAIKPTEKELTKPTSPIEEKATKPAVPSKIETQNTPTTLPEEPMSPIPESTTRNINLISCNGQILNLTETLNQYAEVIEAEPEKWKYSKVAADFKDCSGMFLRLCEALAAKNCSDYIFPSRAFHDTRALAGWYHKNGQLTLTPNPSEKEELIQPGMVLFYGYSNKPIPANYTVEMLSAPYPSGLIEHIGTVTDVKRNKTSNKIIEYTIYHGRSGTKPAKRTKVFAKNTPIHSHWGQPLLAVGFIMTKAS